MLADRQVQVLQFVFGLILVVVHLVVVVLHVMDVFDVVVFKLCEALQELVL